MASDDFTNTNGTALATHDSNWTAVGSWNSNTYGVSYAEIQSNECQINAQWQRIGAYYTASSEDTSEIVLKQVGTGNAVDMSKKRISVRMGSGVLGYYAYFGTPSGDNLTVINLYRGESGGSGTYLNQASGTWACTSDHTLKVVASGTNPVLVSVYVDDVLEIDEHSDSAAGRITSGSPGFVMEQWVNSTLSTSGFDDWTDDAGGGGITGSGTPSLSAITGSGKILAAPTTLYCEGENNPTAVTDLTPEFSAYCTKLSGDIEDVEIQVSAADDKDFSETPSWSSGWITLDTPLSANGRCEDIEYGES
jgi:hypothetical protein